MIFFPPKHGLTQMTKNLRKWREMTNHPTDADLAAQIAENVMDEEQG